MSWPEATSTSVDFRRPYGIVGVEQTASQLRHSSPALKGGVFWRRKITHDTHDTDKLAKNEAHMPNTADLPPSQLQPTAAAARAGAGSWQPDAPTRPVARTRSASGSTTHATRAADGHPRRRALGLGAQMAIGSVVVALAAVLIVSITTLLVVS